MAQELETSRHNLETERLTGEEIAARDRATAASRYNAELQNEASHYATNANLVVGHAQVAASRYATEVGYQGKVYSSDVSADTQRYSIDINRSIESARLVETQRHNQVEERAYSTDVANRFTLGTLQAQETIRHNQETEAIQTWHNEQDIKARGAGVVVSMVSALGGLVGGIARQTK
jgi:hypothetical protein